MCERISTLVLKPSLSKITKFYQKDCGQAGFDLDQDQSSLSQSMLSQKSIRDKVCGGNKNCQSGRIG